MTAWWAMDSASSPSGRTPPKVPRQRKRLMYLVAKRKACVNRICQWSSVRTASEYGWPPVMVRKEHKVNQIYRRTRPKDHGARDHGLRNHGRPTTGTERSWPLKGGERTLLRKGMSVGHPRARWLHCPSRRFF